jgi:hypothetical protein
MPRHRERESLYKLIVGTRKVSYAPCLALLTVECVRTMYVLESTVLVDPPASSYVLPPELRRMRREGRHDV